MYVQLTLYVHSIYNLHKETEKTDVTIMIPITIES